ncbi:MAG: HTH-type transcriptional regulator CysB [Methylococcaceae bacterium]
MKLQQLRYIWEVSQYELNVSMTANKLFTSQSGISKQIRMLEDELGIDIFVRSGKHFIGITEAGRQIINLAGVVLGKIQDIKNMAQEYHNEQIGSLSIATTHTQARYALPPVIQGFMQRYPGVKLNIQQGTPTQIADMASRGLVDLAIATESIELFDNLVMLPCYRWNRCVVVKDDHPLAKETTLTLKTLAEYPIVTYVFGFTGRSQLDKAFEEAGLHPRLALTAVDADVIKTYVRLGLGVGIVAHMAYDPTIDKDLVAIEACHLFESSTTRIGFRRDMFLRGFVYDFIASFAPHLTRERIDAALERHEKHELDALFNEAELPVR